MKQTYVPSPRPRYEKYIDLVSCLSLKCTVKGFRLELGCGDGRPGGIIPNYLGLSISLRELSQIKNQKLDNVVGLLCADAEKIPIQARTIAMIFEHAFLEHVFRPEEVLRECCRIIRPGGIIIHDTAWNVRSWTANPATYKSWKECDMREKLFKMTIPIRNSLIFRFAYTFPIRLFREFRQFVNPQSILDYRKLTPNFDLKIGSDVDACSSIDPHALIMFYKSHGFKTLGFFRRLFFRTGPVIVRVPREVL